MKFTWHISLLLLPCVLGSVIPSRLADAASLEGASEISTVVDTLPSTPEESELLKAEPDTDIAEEHMCPGRVSELVEREIRNIIKRKQADLNLWSRGKLSKAENNLAMVSMLENDDLELLYREIRAEVVRRPCEAQEVGLSEEDVAKVQQVMERYIKQRQHWNRYR